MLENIIKLLSRYWMMFLKGIGVTLSVSAVAVAGGVVLGALLVWMNHSRFKPISWISKAYVDLVRGTPILLQLYVFYLFVSDIFPLSKFASISLALICNSAAYVSEIFRAGIEAVDKGQMEAGRCLGLSARQSMLRIVLPQAVKNILPALCNEFIMMIKETSLASTFFAGDIMTQYKVINGSMFLVIEPLIIIAAIYYLLTKMLSQVVKVFEKRMKTSD